jgi:hypothetical protein
MRRVNPTAVIPWSGLGKLEIDITSETNPESDQRQRMCLKPKGYQNRWAKPLNTIFLEALLGMV